MRIDAGRNVLPPAIVVLTAAALLLAAKSDGYTPFVLALVALTAVVGVGLNILLGLTGQVSLGHVGFYEIGAYTVAILTLKGVDFWIALPLAGRPRVTIQKLRTPPYSPDFAAASVQPTPW